MGLGAGRFLGLDPQEQNDAVNNAGGDGASGGIRPDGYWAARNHHEVNNDYRNVTGYNLGVVAARAGYSLEDTLQGAGFYNKYFGNPKLTDSKYGNDQSQVDVITQGWNDGTKWQMSLTNIGAGEC